MDKAIVGVMRIGYFRIGVTVTKFDVALEQLKKIHLEDSARFDIAHFDRARFDEHDSSLFKAVKEALKRQ